MVWSVGLKTPAFVRKPDPGPRLRTDVSKDVEYAFDGGSPGMNMPTVGSGTVENSRLVTTRLPAGPSKESSTAPPLFGAPNVVAIMSSNAFDSRGFSVNVTTGGAPGQSARKQRYVAVTSRLAV
jgi:hypothetical protein